MKRATVAFFGSSLVSAYWNGAATYYRGILKELNGLGYGVTFYEPDAYDRQKHRDIDDPSWARVHVYRPELCGGIPAALDDARSADIIIKASGVGAFDEFLERAVLDMRRPGSTVIFWDVDAPVTLERVKASPSDPFRNLIPLYDMVLTYGGGRPVVDEYMALGARYCAPVYNALDPATHYRVAADPAFECDLGFLGNRLPDREARVTEFFFRPALECPSRRFILGGSGWDEPGAANVRCAGHVYTRDHNLFNSSSLAVLNVNRESMARYGFSPPTRVFEAAGAGACIITDRWEGIGEFLEPGTEVLVAADGGEVASHLESLTEERASKIGYAAYRRVMASHTYAHRARQFDDIISGKAPA